MYAIILYLLLAVLPPCAGEDSPGSCGWDARYRGNGTGTSFVQIGGFTWSVP